MPDRKAYDILLIMAEKDLRALSNMLNSEIFDDEIFGFHAQQAIEKLFKAWLAWFDVLFPITHNIGKLYDLILELDERVIPYKKLAELTEFGVILRYTPLVTEHETINRNEVIAQVGKLFQLVKSLSSN